VPEVTVSRLVEVSPPDAGVRSVRVTLTNDCLGVYDVFGKSAVTTCIAAGSMSDPTQGVVDVAEGDTSPSVVGTWPGAAPQPCSGTAPPGAQCVAGGFSVIGALGFTGFGDGMHQFDPSPLRPVLLSPFYMDTTEVTVGRFRALVKSGAFKGALPLLQGDSSISDGAWCTWLGPGTAQNDAYPLNCLTQESAVRICAALNGSLPTEAQWEHAARGRGLGNLYPWGNHILTPPGDCCLASVSRDPPPNDGYCSTKGIEKAGSHPASPTCVGGLGDQTRDGILDLGGSMHELVQDTLQPYDASCWSLTGGGILQDPLCNLPGGPGGRGGFWDSGTAAVAVSVRTTWYPNGTAYGVRCVYPGSGT
jgi:formylglycine-generating enzyme required for sulfatase activity